MEEDVVYEITLDEEEDEDGEEVTEETEGEEDETEPTESTEEVDETARTLGMGRKDGLPKMKGSRPNITKRIQNKKKATW